MTTKRMYDVRTDAMSTTMLAESAEQALQAIIHEEGIDKRALSDGAYAIATACDGTDSASVGVEG